MCQDVRIFFNAKGCTHIEMQLSRKGSIYSISIGSHGMYLQYEPLTKVPHAVNCQYLFLT